MMRDARSRTLLLLGGLLLGGLLLLGDGAELTAQQRQGIVPQEVQRQGGRQDPEQLRDARRETMARVQAEHERRMVEALGLTPAQSADLRVLLLRYRESRMEMMRERASIREDLVRHGEAGGTDAEARRILDRMRALRAREIEMQRAEEESLLAILNPSQILQLQVLRDHFSERIRRLEGGRPGGAPRERESPPPGVSSR
jgi:DNA-directed RNA polymerase subunit F